MAKSRSLQQAVRFALASATAAAGVTALHAQEAPAPAAAAPVEEVVVTGSRLQTPNATSISPITSVSATDIAATGLTRTEDILNNLPMVFAGQNSTVSNGSDGTSSVDLRGLGNQRTLTLVNGRRLGPGQSTGVNYSDITQIPAALIERVDVLTGGASSVYGADAVAGVVNFILNTHFQGIKIDAGYAFNQHNNDLNDTGATAAAAHGYPLPPSNVNTGYAKNVSIIMGSNFADDKGNATLYATFDTQQSVLQKSFTYSACNLAPGPNNTFICGGSSISARNGAGGSFRAYQQVSPYNRLINYTVDGANGNTFRPFGVADQFNFAPFNYYQRPAERWTAGGFLHYDLNPHMQTYMEVMVMRNATDAQIAPSGDFGDESRFVPCANPLLNASQLGVLCGGSVNGGGGVNLAQGNPTEIINGVTYPGTILTILRRNVEGGGRDATFVSDSIRAVVGLKGDFGDGVWTYDVYGQRSSVDNLQGNKNYFSDANLTNAFNVIPDTRPGGNGAPVCASVITGADTKCVPYNVWSANGVTPAAIAYLSVPLLQQGSVVEYVVDGSVTGDLTKYGLKLPTADQGLQINVGYEWRQEESDFLPDELSQTGNAAGAGGATPPVSGGFHVNEVFTELRLPLANHIAFADELAIEGGYRYSKYSEGFDTNTYKLGLE